MLIDEFLTVTVKCITVIKVLDEDKQAQKHNTTQKTKNMSNKHPTKNRVFYAL
jgi:hypothetical protein